MNTRDRMSEALMDISGIPTEISKKIVDGAINICCGFGAGILTAGLFSVPAAPVVLIGALGGLASLQIYGGNYKLKPFAVVAAFVCGVGAAALPPFAKTPDIEAAPSAPQRVATTPSKPNLLAHQ